MKFNRLLTLILLAAAAILASCSHPPEVSTCESSADCSEQTPICKINTSLPKQKGAHPKTCQPAASQDECDRLIPPSREICGRLTFDNGTCKKESGPRDGDKCCPKGSFYDQDKDCPVKCDNPATCPTTHPICKPSQEDPGVKTCQAPTEAADCQTLPVNGACEKQVWNAAKEICEKAAVLADPNHSDNCCPTGKYFREDVDCPRQCGDSDDCSGATPVCKPDGSGSIKTCQAPTSQQDCALLDRRNTNCEVHVFDSATGTCTVESGPRDGDQCCPEGTDFSKDNDCPKACTSSEECYKNHDGRPICDGPDSGPKFCRPPNDAYDCGQLNAQVLEAGKCFAIKFNGIDCIAVSAVSATSQDQCCPTKMPTAADPSQFEDRLVYSDTDLDCPVKCNDSTECKLQGDHTVCKADSRNSSSSSKTCQEPSVPQDCATLTQDLLGGTTSANNCSRYVASGSAGGGGALCTLEEGQKAGDGCCPIGLIKSEDSDCEAECRTASDCSDQAKPLCKPKTTGSSVLVCTAPSEQADCDALGNTDLCTTFTYNSSTHRCDPDKTPGKSDSCCPKSGGYYSNGNSFVGSFKNDPDCPKLCDYMNPSSCVKSSDESDVCRQNALGDFICKPAKNATDCADLNQTVIKGNTDCKSWVFDANSNSCKLESQTFMTRIDGDGCCYGNAISAVDNDCPDSIITPYSVNIGEKCADSDSCGGDPSDPTVCFEQKGDGTFKDGYCSAKITRGCGSEDEKKCPSNSVCVSFKPDPSGSISSYCMKQCQTTAKDCRDGYICTQDASKKARYCAPVVPVQLQDAGGSCTSDADVTDGTNHDPKHVCIQERPDDTFRKGYKSVDCTESDYLCPSNTRCVDLKGIGKRCMVKCTISGGGVVGDSYTRPAYMCYSDKDDESDAYYTTKEGVGSACTPDIPPNNIGSNQQVAGVCQVNNAKYKWFCKHTPSGSGAGNVQWYGGYCIAIAKDDSTSCPAGSAKVPGSNDCMKTCNSDKDCRKYYDCKVAPGGTQKFCANEFVSPIVPVKRASDIGGECANDTECSLVTRSPFITGTCLLGPNYPGGYCSYDLDTNPGGYRSCGGKPKNVSGVEKKASWATVNKQYCLKVCQGDGDCRKGYKCAVGTDANYCISEKLYAAGGGSAGGGGGGTVPTSDKIGASCQSNDNCTGGLTCVQGNNGNFCTKECKADTECDPSTDDPDSACKVTIGGKKYCVETGPCGIVKSTCRNTKFSCTALGYCW